MSGNYTGPVLVVPFIGQRDRFVLTLHVNNEDTESIERIVARYAQDGYKPDLKHIRKEYMSNGSLVPREAPVGPAGFRRMSAFLRA